MKENQNSVISSIGYSIYAGICDLYIIASLLTGIIASIEIVLNKPNLASNVTTRLEMTLISAPLIITLVIIYHSIISKKVLWLSFGEKIAGKFIIDNKKKWRNPYNENRWRLFFLCIIILIILGYSFNIISSVYQYRIPVLVGKFIRLAVQIYSCVMIGQGKLKASLVFIALHIISILYGVVVKIPLGIITFFVILLLLEIIIFYTYYKLALRQKTE